MEKKGTVYFFTGLSGAGKTTLGGLFYRRLKEQKPNVVRLDGDEIRPVFGEDSGYTFEDRRRRSAQTCGACIPNLQNVDFTGNRRSMLQHFYV